MSAAPRAFRNRIYTLSLTVPAAFCVDQQLAVAQFQPTAIAVNQVATPSADLRALLAQPSPEADLNVPLQLLNPALSAQTGAAVLLTPLPTAQPENAIAALLASGQPGGVGFAPEFTPNPAWPSQHQYSRSQAAHNSVVGQGLPGLDRFAPELSGLTATIKAVTEPTSDGYISDGHLSSKPRSDRHLPDRNPPEVGAPTVEEPWLPLHRRPPYPKSPLTNQNANPAPNTPGVTISNPSAQSLSWGSIGLGIGFQERTRFSNTADGGLGLGLGLGDPNRAVGIQVGLGLVDLSDLFADGSLSVEIHRAITPEWTIALGVTGLATWGSPDGGSSLYGVTTKRFRLRPNPKQPLSELTLSLGIGGGQFRSEQDILDEVDGVGVFGSAAIRIVEPVNGIVEWTGQDLTVGLSITPFPRLPFVITPAVTDITGNAGDGARFIFGAGLGIRF